MTLTQFLIFTGYLGLFVISVALMLWWRQRSRKHRLPFGEDFKLLRTAGETQLKLVRKFDDDAAQWLLLASVAPAFAAMAMLIVVAKLPADFQMAGIALTLLAFAGIWLYSARWLTGKLREAGNRYLGYFGERIVAEQLEPLKAAGWQIFHDVPMSNAGVAFNIDHVAVGPGGIFSIETKTRRKGGARPGFADHKVYFDGRDLIWPWGEDNHGLDQAERNAFNLAALLKTETGLGGAVTPLLTLPGWFVELKPTRESRLAKVVNPRLLAQLIATSRPALSADQVGAIATALEKRCRDVEY